MNIAIVAHDARKKELIEWVKFNYEELSKHKIFATGTTGKLIEELYIGEPESGKWDEYEFIYDYKDVVFPFRNKVTKLLSGPLGGDQQIGAMIGEGKIDALIFFCDNMITQGHQQDVSAVSRLASLYNIPFASNRTTADMILTSTLWNNPKYERVIPECIERYARRRLE